MKWYWAAAVATIPMAAFAQDLPKAETLFEKYVEVTGGKAGYAKRRSEVARGIVRMAAAGVTGTVEIYSQAPNSQVVVMDVQGVGKIEQGTNGSVAWESSAIMGPRVKSGQERAEALREALFNIPLNWRKLYLKLETVSAETVEGHDCYKVVATPNLAGGKPEYFWFDRTSGLNVKIKRTSLTSMGEIPAELVYDNYKKFGAVSQPTTMLQRAGTQEVMILLQSVETNVAIPAARFVPPAEIRQLMTPASATPSPQRRPAAPAPATAIQSKKKAA
jgi:hypothetical protein